MHLMATYMMMMKNYYPKKTEAKVTCPQQKVSHCAGAGVEVLTSSNPTKSRMSH